MMNVEKCDRNSLSKSTRCVSSSFCSDKPSETKKDELHGLNLHLIGDFPIDERWRNLPTNVG